MVQHLVRAGAKVSVRDSQGNTALHLACLHGEVDCAREILANNVEAFDLQQWNYNGEFANQKWTFSYISLRNSSGHIHISPRVINRAMCVFFHENERLFVYF
jgi:ankyrin repeat protein